MIAKGKLSCLSIALLTTCFFVSNSIANCTYTIWALSEVRGFLIAAKGDGCARSLENVLQDFFTEMGINSAACRSQAEGESYSSLCSMTPNEWVVIKRQLKNGIHANFKLGAAKDLNCQRQEPKKSKQVVEFQCHVSQAEEKEEKNE